MHELLNAWNKVDRNKVAAAMSVVPGLGHLYKHHYLQGLGLLVIGNVLILFISGLLSLGTFGLSLGAYLLWQPGNGSGLGTHQVGVVGDIGNHLPAHCGNQ